MGPVPEAWPSTEDEDYARLMGWAREGDTWRRSKMQYPLIKWWRGGHILLKVGQSTNKWCPTLRAAVDAHEEREGV